MIGRTSSAAWVKGVADMMSAQGLDTRSLFAQAGIDIAVLQDPAARIPADAMSQVWELAVAQSGNGHLGLDRPWRRATATWTWWATPRLRPPSARGSSGWHAQMAVVSDAATFALEEEAQGFWLTLATSARPARAAPARGIRHADPAHAVPVAHTPESRTAGRGIGVSGAGQPRARSGQLWRTDAL